MSNLVSVFNPEENPHPLTESTPHHKSCHPQDDVIPDDGGDNSEDEHFETPDISDELHDGSHQVNNNLNNKLVSLRGASKVILSIPDNYNDSTEQETVKTKNSRKLDETSFEKHEQSKLVKNNQ